MKEPWGVIVWITLVILFVEGTAHAQFAAPCRAPAPQDFRGATLAEIGGFLELVPSICVSERYDSNVFYRPSTPGLEREDYVTSVNPKLRVNHRGGYARGFIEIGGISETYVKNPGLNFLGSNSTLFLNLDDTVKKVFPNASLSMTDAMSYAPLPPGFVNPVAGTNPGAISNFQDTFAQGLIFARTNRVSNNGTVSVGYDTSASTKVTASYSHGILRFLSPTSSVNVFSTTNQFGTVEGTAQVSGVDQLATRYSFVQSDFDRGSASSFLLKSHAATATWSRILTPRLTVVGGGGGIILDSGKITYAANAALMMNAVNVRTTLSYNRSVFPGFIGVPTQLVGEVVSLSVFQQISSQWTLSGVANYSHSAGTSGGNSIKFDSYGGSVDLAYLVTKVWSTALGYSYLRFDGDGQGFSREFDRHVVMVSLRTTWE